MSGRLVCNRAFCTFGSYATRLIESALAFFFSYFFQNCFYFFSFCVCRLAFRQMFCIIKQHPVRREGGGGGGGVREGGWVWKGSYTADYEDKRG